MSDVSAANEVRLNVERLLREFPKCPTSLRTGCPLWPHLLAFLQVVRPRTEQLTCETLGSTNGLNLAAIIVNGFLNHLANRLDLVARQTILLEKAVFEHQAATVRPLKYAEMAAIFTNDSDKIRDLYETYPELGRIAAVQVRDFITFADEFVQRLLSDCPNFVSIVRHPFDLADIIGLELSPGETHCGHRAVITIITAHGPVCGYKPRNLTFENSITSLLRELTTCASDQRVQHWTLPRYLCRGDYGWVEWLPQRPATSSADVQRFYVRCGYLIAFSTALLATDLHSGNIVAHGDSPIPVDLEACLSHAKRKTVGEQALSDEFQWNSLSTGLLPNWIWKGADMIGVDLSGLGGLDPQYCSAPVYQNSKKGTEDETFEEAGVYIEPANNIVFLDDEKQRPFDYLDEIIDGFRAAISDLQARRNDVDTFVSASADMEIRFIARNTVGYHYTVQCSYHPKYMLDSEARRAFIRLCLDNETVIDAKLLEGEVAACFNCEIPRLVSRPSSLDIVEPLYGGSTTLSPERFIPGLIATAGVRNRLTGTRIEFEERLIAGTLTSLRMVHNGEVTDLHRDRLLIEDAIEFDDTHVHDALRLTSDFLVDYVRSELARGFDWYGFKISPGNTAEYGVLGDDQYCGVAGVLYALLHLSRIGYLYGFNLCEIASAFCDRLTAQYRLEKPRLGGAYVGAASCFLPMTLLLREVRPDLEPIYLESAKRRVAEVLKDRNPSIAFWGLDMFTGVAGLVGVCGTLASLTNDPTWLELGEGAFCYMEGKSLNLDGAVLFPQGPSISMHPNGLLTGLSHGAIGIAVALEELRRSSPEPQLKERLTRTISGLIEWEISQFDANVMNWPDFRIRSATAHQGEITWSHGAPGVYLALSQLSERGFEPAGKFLRRYPYEKALELFVTRDTFPVSETLCQGSLGIYLSSRRILGNRFGSHQRALERWTRLGYYIELDRRAQRLRATDAPGLWIGKAGTVLGYSSYLNNLRVPLPLLPGDFLLSPKGEQQAATEHAT